MRVSPEDVSIRLTALPGWSGTGDALTCTYKFPTFPDSVAFVTRLAFEAEAADHHPDLLVSYRKVTVTWSTHSEGGVTDKDFAGVEQSDRIAAQMRGA